MKLEPFFEEFDQLADAPDAIPAMRELILQLAVRGKLTQRACGETSNAQIALANAFRVHRAKREKPDSGDIPFPIPENWGWVAVGDSMDMFNGRAFKPEEWSTEGTPIVRIQNLNNEHATFNRCKADLDPRIHVHDGDFLISWSGTPGTSFGAFIWNRGFAFLNQHIFRCELVKGVFEKEFLRLAINARLDEMISHAQGAVGLRHITKGKLESIRLPLPPLAEQKRIVTKVGELMALCDRLEAQQRERETRHVALVRASLARFADTPNPANIQFLFHSSYVITPADLRKSILTLAVQGKLVSQCPNDEPAELSLARVLRDRARQERSLRIKEPALVQADAEHTTDLPSGWCYASPDQLTAFHKNALTIGPFGSSLLKSDYTDEGVPLVFVRDIRNESFGGAGTRFVSNDKAEELASHTVISGDLLITKMGDPPGDTAVYPEGRPAAIITADCIKLTPNRSVVSAEYLKFCIRASQIVEQFAEITLGVAQQKVSLGRFRCIAVPLPPVAEQRRIVAKIEQLMALVEQLESQLVKAQSAGTELLDAVVQELIRGVVPT